MKTIILLSLFSFSSFAHSEVVAADKFHDVVQAIKDSLSTKDLACNESVQNVNFKASTIDWDFLPRAEMKINENQQPVIIFHRDGTYDTTVEVTTNSDFTVVEEIKVIQNVKPVTNTTTTRKNVGTILNPKYETKTESVTIKGYLHSKTECK
jgi:hypothetical protein